MKLRTGYALIFMNLFDAVDIFFFFYVISLLNSALCFLNQSSGCFGAIVQLPLKSLGFNFRRLHIIVYSRNYLYLIRGKKNVKIVSDKEKGLHSYSFLFCSIVQIRRLDKLMGMLGMILLWAISELFGHQ